MYLSFFPPPFSQVFVFGNRKGKLRQKIFLFFSSYSTDLFYHYYTDSRGRQEPYSFKTDMKLISYTKLKHSNIRRNNAYSSGTRRFPLLTSPNLTSALKRVLQREGREQNATLKSDSEEVSEY